MQSSSGSQLNSNEKKIDDSTELYLPSGVKAKGKYTH